MSTTAAMRSRRPASTGCCRFRIHLLRVKCRASTRRTLVMTPADNPGGMAMAHPRPAGSAQVRYEFLVDGVLSERALAAFPELTVAPAVHAYTALYGPVDDATRLRG